MSTQHQTTMKPNKKQQHRPKEQIKTFRMLRDFLSQRLTADTEEEKE